MLWLAGCGREEEPSPKAPAAGSRPNVLVVVADDLASRAVGAFGGPYDLTPNLDRLAGEGVAFRRAVVSSPFCTPSRQSFLTGRWPHAIGVTQIDSDLPEDATTLAQVFRAAGYRTAALGKMHWHRERWPGRDFGFDRIEDIEEWLAQLTESERARYDQHRELWSERDQPGWAHLNLEGRAQELPEERMYSAWLVDESLRFIAEEDRRPFLAFCSFREVHPPCVFPQSLAGRVDPAALELPAGELTDLARNAPGIYRHKQDQFRRLGPLDESGLRRFAASYLQSAAWLDRQVGRLLDGLDEAGRSADTIVLFWSDHGYFLGEHGLTGKNFPFREALEIPFVLRGPGIGTGERFELVQLLDAFPTLCELTGVPLPDRLDGRSLVPLLVEGKKVRESALAEFMGLWISIQTERWKLVVGKDPREGLDQLYDLVADPGETRNLVGDPKRTAVIAELIGEIHATLAASPPDWLSRELWLAEPDPLLAVRRAVSRAGPR